MRGLLDTNVLSETIKPAPSEHVLRYLSGLDESETYLSVISLAELKFGIEKLPMGAKRGRLQRWFEQEIPMRFAGRVLGIDQEIAAEWGRIRAEALRAGKPLSEMDGWIAALASKHSLVLVTRNVTDFAGFDGRIVNPWDEIS
ncbi:MAG: type II toxin-antitoxin system VapC family toxin [Acidobacteria bacterium]|nr:type II toxin-antitoxin system VapC family toxin [Acidobacteriota bacterium]